MNDPIGDLLTRIRNAGLASHEVTRSPHSKMRERIVAILRDEGYLEGFSVEKSESIGSELVIQLRYGEGNKPAIHTMKRISKPGRRKYSSAEELPTVKSGLGVAIVSTSKGVITDREARRLNVGGEVLCEIW
ncbi:MAG: 30S ribosomal protein S8 [Proteobacteria bacterium]|jgi:small subunit ribosomal protein S8|nr:30S ribosomal protein S8 [Pseudomonadota bacterium]